MEKVISMLEKKAKEDKKRKESKKPKKMERAIKTEEMPPNKGWRRFLPFKCIV